MYERFTDRARRVMQLANAEAQRFNHEYIGTEHILLGLIREGSGVAANVLKGLEVDLQKIRLEVEKIVQSGPDLVISVKLPETPRAKKVIEYAIEEVGNLHHNYVGTEHLLLGLIREEEGVAAQVLRNLGVELEDVREGVSTSIKPHVIEAERLTDAGVTVALGLELGPLLVVLDDRISSLEDRMMKCAQQNGHNDRAAQLAYMEGSEFEHPRIRMARDLVLVFRNQIAENLRFRTRIVYDESESDYVLLDAGYLIRKEDQSSS